ncbi:DNA mismatch repair protein MutS [Clostridium tertium]|jgi:DNA mismatch repair protein MutS|uniref:DNA mismatch repair protein MutS n=1 Tax=Clostridium tertium TaxID=1559 RepID=A0A9X3XN44_9CLOT|nr:MULTISPECIES: DNA mismatch repair protein MutS [Clostridium]MBU6135429.1 DNA mismatch repair protein MutS [Clostridium tertium]MDB1934947.1 DNA mismatch repair protein MutS [Clostridium tertium]MDB1938821.1 DNA mismatch repair protein MutS [Clostridium tertium]MDB1955025.1 DNA mismatch repair protein MutS [Clostridium tertium]MDB1962608.1 DNA mismatch repair protein MutS [Clostridium tertium]
MLTPMMRQYFEIKENYKDCILFFRLGDFYEMFFEDAKIASRELELVLTGRDCGLEERAPMCGIPFHAASSYIARLVNKGYKVAIGEQVEDVSVAKGIVKRDVIKVITPGTYIENTEDSEYKNTYLMCIVEDNGYYGLASSDISTGEFKVTSFTAIKASLLDEITKIAPKEIIVDINISDELLSEITSISSALITKRDLSKSICTEEELLEQFSEVCITNLNDLSKTVSKALLKYIYDTQKMTLTNINLLEYYDIINYMTIDGNSRRNLELTENLKEKSKKGSLIWVLDKTATSMGGRAIRKWIEEPLIIKSEIEKRLEGVEELYNNAYFNEDLRSLLKEIYDIERIVGKISNKNANAKDLISLKCSLEKLPGIKSHLSEASSNILKEWYKDLDELTDIKELLSNSILDDPSIALKEGNIIKDGYNEEVDSLRTAKLHGKEWIAALENRERDFTGIRSLKVGYNKVFGYYIEISKANYSSIPEGRYIRKQTLANAERFITQELKEMEDKILGAEEKLVSLEYDLFIEIREAIEKEIARLKQSARIIGNLDALSTLSLIAVENDYVKPSINEDGIIEINEGRHPVVEKVIGKGEFVSNDTTLNSNDNRLLLITGPNMAGKSTYMRQVALITLMAQIGSFVPAKSANISICDKIFTRIGASDDLAGGKSTFMVEMWEVSNILKNATSKSLVLLDEVGRGTSTYDGLSIAWSVIEYISKNNNLKCKTLFATHYHELTKLEGVIEGVKNYSVAVSEIDDNIIFLRKIVEGGADQSYGIEVAKLAGLPTQVIDRAKEILSSLENTSGSNSLDVTSIKEVATDKFEKDDVNKSVNIKETVEVPTSYSNPLDNAKEESNESYIEKESEPINNTLLEDTNIKKGSKKKKNSKDEINDYQIDFTMIEKENLINSLADIDVMALTPMDAMNTLYKLILEAKRVK